MSISCFDEKYLKEFQNKYMQYSSSLKTDIISPIIISNANYHLEKKIKIILLEELYLKKRVKYKEEPIAINNVLENILGDVKALTFTNPDTNNSINLENITVVNSGFLSVEPAIFMSRNFFEKLGYKRYDFTKLELDIKLEEIQSLKEKADVFGEKYSIYMKYDDILSKNKSTQELFDKIRYMEYIVLSITSILSFIILTGALNIIAKIKEKAISLLRIYGLSTSLISGGLTLMSILILLISIFLAYILFIGMKIYFIANVGLESDFFISLDNKVLYIVSAIFTLFTLLTYLWSYKTFKGKITL